MRHPVGTTEMTSDSEQRFHQLLAQSAAYRRRHRELASQVALLAGQIADTEDRIAEQAECAAQQDPARADEHGHRARRAREYSAYERRQQRRWAAVAAAVPRY